MHLLIFDLDGTLIDSKQDLARAVNAARSHLGMPTIDEGLIASYVGNGAPVLLRRAIGPDAPAEVVQQALEFFLEYYSEHRIDFTRPYPGVEAGLEQLREVGIQMAVLTNKPVRVSRAILEDLGLNKYFRNVYGGNSFEHKKPHPIGVETLMAQYGVSPEQTMIVGDSAVDIRTARNAGVKVCGVTYGFQPESFQDDPPDFVVDSLEELAEWIINQRKGIER